MNLTKHFTLAEMTVSQSAARDGIKNTPSASQAENLRLLCENILEPLRLRVRRPVVINSGFRSASVNRRIGGSNKSQHCKGEAADLIIPGMEVAEVAMLIRRMNLPYDQLIDEFGQWVHVSFSPRNRRQFLTSRYSGGQVVYKGA